ncbi:MAG: lytic transglycosylase domain-containing protein [Acidobacteriota bacterium]
MICLRLQGVLATFATLAFLLSSGGTGVSAPPTPPSVEIPSPEEIAVLDELALWLTDSDEGSLGTMSPVDIRAAVRERPETFELFRSYNLKEDNHRYLESVPFGGEIVEAAERYDLDSLLVAAVIEVESGFLPHAVSPVGAVGLMQVMPATGGFSTELSNPAVNLDIGARYLRQLLDTYDGDLELALAAYNAGPGNVRRFGGIPPFRETRRYVSKVISTYVDIHRSVWDDTGATDLIVLN